LGCGEGGDNVDRLLASALLIGAPHSLAIDGDGRWRHADLIRDPGDKAASKGFWIEGRKNVAKMIMGRYTVFEGAEPAQQVELVVAEPGDVDDRLGASQNSQQTQKKDFIERIANLAALAMIRQILKMLQKNNTLR
jgi:hypothetical protein